ncbi:hypothetical protein [Pedobacter glucosidilyticus]|uniref:hypothetical protein n=1 Tax=Pedobacter glucosidilyticus TaxID=1122941 RepID=UPI00041DC726|nr:hypothetical protein [Pedobacter glucosidilyticus]
MANSKISQLPNATIPLEDDDYIPVVQGIGNAPSTKKVKISELKQSFPNGDTELSATVIQSLPVYDTEDALQQSSLLDYEPYRTSTGFVKYKMPSSSNITPPPPVAIADDVLNTLAFTHELGSSEIVVSTNDGPYMPYSLINVGDVYRPAGYYKAKIKAAPGRNESGITNSPIFLSNNITPPPPVAVADDVLNTLAFTHELGSSEIVVSTNNGSYMPYSPINVGDLDRPIGYYKAKIKAAPGRNESMVTNSPAFTASGSSDEYYLDNFTKLPLDFEIEPGKTILENPPGIFNAVTTGTAETKSYTGLKMNVGGALAMRHGSVNAFIGIGEGNDSIFLALRLYIGFNDLGAAVYGTLTGETVLNIQTQPGDFLVLSSLTERLFEIRIISGQISTKVADVDINYNLLSLTGIVKAKLGIEPISHADFPQGTGLISNL